MEAFLESSAYLWFDTEYTTLDLEKARLLQVSLVITDVNLDRLAPVEEDLNLVVRLDDGVSVSPWLTETMPELVNRCRSGEALPVEEIDVRLEAYVNRHVVVPMGDDKKKPILAGNSIHADWFLAHRFLPRFSSRLHYRHLDVTTLKLQWQDWLRRADKFEKDDPALVRKFFPGFNPATMNRQHDAYYDVQASIAEMNYYRKYLFKRPPQG